jgi:MYXO-CTERM domain-containing protein
MSPVNARKSTLPVLAAALFMTFTTSARADVPPADECPNTQSAGQPCTTAGKNFNEDGVCVSTTCTSAGRPGVPSSTFACLICMLPDAASPAPVDSGAVDSSAVDSGSDVGKESSAPATHDAAVAAVDANGTTEADDAALSPTTKDASVEAATVDSPPSQELESSGCSMTSARGHGAAIEWPLALLGGLAFFATARRRRWS